MIISTLALPVFFAGILMFLAPCTLPILPAYVSFIAGVSKEKKEFYTQETKNKIQKNALFFVFGFSLIFILLGILLGFAGGLIGFSREIILKVSGFVILLLGIGMLFPGFWNFSGLQIKIPQYFKVNSKTSSFLFGAVFALGWSPCVGPILGTVLVLAGTSGTVFSGAVLLFIFSLGFSLPFLVLARWYSKLSVLTKKLTIVSRVFSIVGAILIILIGILLISDSWVLFAEWGFKIFEIFNYEAIQKYF